MLADLKSGEKMSKEEYSSQMETLRQSMGRLQQRIMQKKIPVTVVFEGWGAAGKGSAIAKLIYSMDPRGFVVANMPPEEDPLHSMAECFGSKMPRYGEMVIFNRSWYRRAYHTLAVDRNLQAAEEVYQEIRAFERMAVDDGGVIVKFFLHITKEEQKKRLRALQDSRDTSWRVTKRDREQNRQYEQNLAIFDVVMEHTNFDFAPWTVVDAKDKRRTTVTVYQTIIEAIEKRLSRRNRTRKGRIYTGGQQLLDIASVRERNPHASIGKEEYDERLKQLQKEVGRLHNLLYLKRIPVIVCYEGWDAAGKGGNIKRLTRGMDPRGYEVFPIAAPDATEKAHHYLWRFATRLPKAGHIAIFDRTWYGRVMVERIEGFCKPEEWKRAFGEINEFEKSLYDWGAVIIKFFINVDKDEQLRRFEERRATPEKRWKLTEEDWRNREKWGAYEQAIDDMLRYTNTEYAPWYVVDSNDKRFARIEALKLFIAAVRERLDRPHLLV